ncbi:hypothetical protein SAMN06265346_12329 [Flavobacterium hercynium]|nr:hypothetical protein SAMN06265346_12329 [Flavobacterium hercynium]
MSFDFALFFILGNVPDVLEKFAQRDNVIYRTLYETGESFTILQN